ncbi:MAG: hypothetical protein K2L13_00820, partial [Opitutales bacterium]|nr:hypothetical protein [Opitutales bacterium]
MGKVEIQIIINGQSKVFNDQFTVLEALKSVNINIPSPCCHVHLNSTHHCGLCFVGIKFPEKSWNMYPACAVKICDKMEIDTEFPQAVLWRSTIMDLYLVNHSLDCSNCDKAENCFLRKFAFGSKFHGISELFGTRECQKVRKKLGDKISIDNAQCILCGRCLSFCNDVLGEDILGKIKNEQNIDEINTYPGREFNNNYSLNLVDLCPVGAIINNNRDSAHMAWNLQRTPSVSPESSVGINTYILHDKKHVYRIIPRENEHVNQSWMTDSARELHKILEPQNRIFNVQKSGKTADLKMTLAHAANKILSSNKGIYVVCSGEMSLEDQFVLKRFLDVTSAIPYFVKKTIPGDGFLVSDDPYPNTNGAKMMRLSTEANTHVDLKDLYADISNGKCDNVICVYEDIFDESVDDAQLADVNVTYIGYRRNRTSQIANFVFPVATIFERSGTFINKD